MRQRKKLIIGWIGVSITILFSSIWAYWGAFENFHEGWYSPSLPDNLFMLIFQYLLFTICFVLLAVITLRWKKLGFLLHLALGGFCAWFFSGASFQVVGLMIVIPFAVLGIIYYIGEPEPKKWAYRLIIGIPLTIIIAISIPLGIQNSRRINDRDFGMRIVKGNDITLAWAPRGPGWPDEGVSWDEAVEICAYLSEDGLTIMEESQHIWRLPTVEEAVRSMQIHGEPSVGIWDPVTEKATYEKKPDKETPLWDPESQIIYYWTADTSADNDEQAYIIVYHGGVFDKTKRFGPGYQSFRAVKDIPATD